MVCFLICFTIWDCELMFDMAVTVGILGAIADDVSGILGAGGLAFDSPWFATILSSPIRG